MDITIVKKQARYRKSDIGKFQEVSDGLSVLASAVEGGLIAAENSGTEEFSQSLRRAAATCEFVVALCSWDSQEKAEAPGS